MTRDPLTWDVAKHALIRGNFTPRFVLQNATSSSPCTVVRFAPVAAQSACKRA